jgi:hypothetical protein
MSGKVEVPGTFSVVKVEVPGTDRALVPVPNVVVPVVVTVIDPPAGTSMSAKVEVPGTASVVKVEVPGTDKALVPVPNVVVPVVATVIDPPAGTSIFLRVAVPSGKFIVAVEPGKEIAAAAAGSVKGELRVVAPVIPIPAGAVIEAVPVAEMVNVPDAV